MVAGGSLELPDRFNNVFGINIQKLFLSCAKCKQ